MRKITLLLLNSLLIFALAACSSNPSNEAAEQTNSGKVDEVSPETNEKPNETVTKSPIAKPDGLKHTLVLSTFYEEDFFNEAVKKYEVEHPNITIKLNIAHPKGNDINWEADHEKFVKTMNTQILTGTGPDVLEMDQLPIGQYVSKKALLNLSEMMNNDPSFQREQYFTNVLDNLKLNGGVYGLPVRFYLYGITSDEAAIQKAGVPFDDKSWTWNRFMQTSKELIQKGDYEYVFMSIPEYVLDEMVQADYSTFVDQINHKANFDSAAFIGMLHQVKEMVDEKILYNPNSSVHIGRLSQAYFTMDMISSIRRFVLDGTNHVKLYNKPISEGQTQGGFFRTETTLGINAKSSIKSEAWDFVKFLISEKVEPGGFPLNKNVYK
ncbi:ABC transporter substrate-binding protein [Paenibacillus psychroresistens]|uniref:ABC transporter substrate-binding protein n=1 Tax=Paenibacillus psychroresistens TaxID=1778678 RepID=UPI001D04DFF5|nr:extracellular solute-binding protein [Paenibacillus psychroresistens]